jgi:hypothetical protein
MNMTTSFDALKKNRSKSLEKLNSQLEKLSAKSYADPHEGKFWKPTRDKAGNGFAIIRFLPPQLVKRCRSFVCGITDFKGQLVFGTSKTL